MNLAPASKVLATMGIVENTGSLASAGNVLGISSSIVENLLETSLASEHRTDYFEGIDGEFHLRLTNMFIDGDTLAVRRSTNGESLTSPTDGELVPSAEYTLDPVKGLLRFPLAQRYPLSVAYDSGFSASINDPEVLDAPVWLQDIAVSITIYGMGVLQTSVTNRKDRAVSSIADELRNIASMLLNSRRRPRLTVAFPVSSTLDE